MKEIDPAKIGNTIQSSPKRHYILTIKTFEIWNRSNSSNLNNWLKEHCDSYAWQIEKGNETGYVHIQLTLSLKKKQRLTWLKRHLIYIAHIEECRNIEASFDYSCKSKTRLEGPYIYPKPIDHTETIPDPLLNYKLYDWQENIISTITGPVDPRKIYWFWEPVGNIGKSDFCLHCILKYDAIVYDGAKKDILYAHTGNKIIFFDLSRSCEGYVSYDAIEQLKKGFSFSGKYESKMKVYPKPHVIIFANFPPDISKLSIDRWVVEKIRKTRENIPLSIGEDNSLIEPCI